MHGGAPYLQETKAILAVYPRVYVDPATINWILPRQEFHNYLCELMYTNAVRFLGLEGK